MYTDVFEGGMYDYHTLKMHMLFPMLVLVCKFIPLFYSPNAFPFDKGNCIPFKRLINPPPCSLKTLYLTVS